MTNNIIKVSRREMAEFILAQEDDKRVDFCQTRKEDSCGCLMVQYGLKNNISFDRVGCIGFLFEGKLMAKLNGFYYNHFFPFKMGNPDNFPTIYKQLKERAQEVLIKS